MKIRRDIASVPARSASETWKAIVDLITDSDTVDRSQLDHAASVMESLIADEHPAKVPIVVKGKGPRLVVYCLFGEDAVEAGLAIERLSWNPTAGDWRMTAPTAGEDVDWMARRLVERASRITVHDVAKPPVDDERAPSDSAAGAVEIDWGALGER
ncbi:hypothetical protein J4558_08135 [Leptolyngbya sp. 15MV]|nr:hypothetical protein J4558_08135 [Leptolyngbya sp. 15MV]